MKKSLLLLLLLCGCNTVHDLKPFQVDVPVVAQCHQELPAEPKWAMTTTSPDADIADQGKAALIEIKQRESYEEQLKASILSCK